jgi:hypothetical protein
MQQRRTKALFEQTLKMLLLTLRLAAIRFCGPCIRWRRSFLGWCTRMCRAGDGLS